MGDLPSRTLDIRQWRLGLDTVWNVPLDAKLVVAGNGRIFVLWWQLLLVSVAVFVRLLQLQLLLLQWRRLGWPRRRAASYADSAVNTESGSHPDTCIGRASS